jgi:hypothetical protein
VSLLMALGFAHRLIVRRLVENPFEDALHFSAQMRMIILERQDVVRSLLANLLWRLTNASTGRQMVRYGERKRPEHRSVSRPIYAQVAYAPRTVSRTCNHYPL